MFVSGRVNWLKHIKPQDLRRSATNKLVKKTRPTLKTWWFRWNILNDWYNQRLESTHVYISRVFLLTKHPSQRAKMISKKALHLHIALCSFPTAKKNNKNKGNFFPTSGVSRVQASWNHQLVGNWPIPMHPGKINVAGSPKNHPFLKRKINNQKPPWFWVPS